MVQKRGQDGGRVTRATSKDEVGEAAAARYLDGPSLVKYQVPSKVVETMYCRKEEAPMECNHQHGGDYHLCQGVS